MTTTAAAMPAIIPIFLPVLKPSAFDSLDICIGEGHLLAAFFIGEGKVIVAGLIEPAFHLGAVTELDLDASFVVRHAFADGRLNLGDLFGQF